MGLLLRQRHGRVASRASVLRSRLCRFLNQDPIGFGGGINVYSYAGNNPVNGIDPGGNYVVRLGYHPVWGGGYHSFVLVQDNVSSSATFGQSWVFDAESQYMGLAPLLDLGGDIIDHSRHWDDQSMDWPAKTGGNKYLFLAGNNKPIGPVLANLKTCRHYMAQQHIPYRLGGPNSNSFAAEILTDLGLWPTVVQIKRALPWLPGLWDDPWDHHVDSRPAWILRGIGPDIPIDLANRPGS